MNLSKFKRPHSIPENLMELILEDFEVMSPMTIHEYNDLRAKWVKSLNTAQLAELDSSSLVKCVLIKPEVNKGIRITPANNLIPALDEDDI